jgi:hypothetical protein
MKGLDVANFVPNAAKVSKIGSWRAAEVADTLFGDREARKALKQVAIYDDSYEVARGLLDDAALLESTGERPYAYWNREADVHIRGLWNLTKRLARELEARLPK